MSKKNIALIVGVVAVILVLGIVLTIVLGGKKQGTTKDNTPTNNEQTQESVSTDEEETKSGNVATEYKNTGAYRDDLALGFETIDVTVNGKKVTARVDYLFDSSRQANGPYYVDYEITVANQTVKEGKYYLSENSISSIKELTEEDIGVNFEFFEKDFVATTVKGEDKEYISISIPAGDEEKDASCQILATDDGKLLQSFVVEKVSGVTLTGKENAKYTDKNGNVIFHSTENGKVTYLIPVDLKGNKIESCDKDKIELEEHTIELKDGKTIDTKTNETYTLNNTKGKSFTFSIFVK